MNLGKLLATGKSIISGRSGAKYRSNKNVYLPKFEADRNPFAPAVAVTPDLPVAPKPAVSLAEVKTRPLPTLPVAPVSQPEKAAKPEKPVSTGWASKISSVAIWRGWQAEVKARHAVQAELSLDSVKVVHNDLSDAEVEVVPIKSRPVTTQPARAAALAEEKHWEADAEHLLKVN